MTKVGDKKTECLARYCIAGVTTSAFAVTSKRNRDEDSKVSYDLEKQNLLHCHMI